MRILIAARGIGHAIRMGAALFVIATFPASVTHAADRVPMNIADNGAHRVHRFHELAPAITNHGIEIDSPRRERRYFVVAMQHGQQEERPQQRRRRGGFGGPIELGPDDKQTLPDPPAGFKEKREDIPHGKLEMMEYDSNTVGTTRKMNVYTPPGYSAETKYPVLYLLHGIGGDETEWQRFSTPDVLLDNLIADGNAVPMIVVMPM